MIATDPPRFMTELRQLARLATPLLAAQLLTTGTGVVDTLMSGHYHANDLAAVAIGNSLWLPLYLFIAGLTIATTSMVARFHGAKNSQAIIVTIQQGIWLALAVSVVASIILINSRVLLDWFNVGSAMAPITEGYLRAIAFAMPAAAIYNGLRSFCEGMGRTKPYMLSSLIAFLINIPLNYGLIYGYWGLPELGGVGCGWATAASMWLQVLLLGIFTARAKHYDGIDLYRQWLKPNWVEIRKIAVIGLPISAAVLAEVSIFSTIALLLSPLGASVVGGHQIALNVSHLIFMFPLSLSQAITIRVGYFLGKKSQAQANFVARTGVFAGAALSLSTMAFILLSHETLARFYTSDPEVLAIAAPLFVWMAIYQFPDQLQITANAALRGYQDTRVPLRIIIFAYWAICLPLGYILSCTDWLHTPMAAQGFWLGLVVGLTITAVLLITRLLKIAHQPMLQK
jgi:MATE family multidrug resistance protein